MKKNSNYNLKLRKILKTYDSILIKCKNIPALLDKNIVMACDIKGMVNAQIEIGKPIIYINEADSTTFILLDCSDVYVYILKADESKESTIEKMIREVDVAKNMFIKEIMKNVENILLKSNTDSQNLFKQNEIKVLRNASGSMNENIYINTNKEKNMDLVHVTKTKRNCFFKKKKNKH